MYVYYTPSSRALARVLPNASCAPSFSIVILILILILVILILILIILQLIIVILILILISMKYSLQGEPLV